MGYDAESPKNAPLYIIPPKKNLPEPELYTDQTKINSVEEARHLGVTTTKDLQFHSHITKVCMWAKGLLGRVKRCFTSRNSWVILKLYLRETSHWSPMLEYAAAVEPEISDRHTKSRISPAQNNQNGEEVRKSTARRRTAETRSPGLTTHQKRGRNEGTPSKHINTYIARMRTSSMCQPQSYTRGKLNESRAPCWFHRYQEALSTSPINLLLEVPKSGKLPQSAPITKTCNEFKSEYDRYKNWTRNRNSSSNSEWVENTYFNFRFYSIVPWNIWNPMINPAIKARYEGNFLGALPHNVFQQIFLLLLFTLTMWNIADYYWNIAQPESVHFMA